MVAFSPSLPLHLLASRLPQTSSFQMTKDLRFHSYRSLFGRLETLSFSFTESHTVFLFDGSYFRYANLLAAHSHSISRKAKLQQQRTSGNVIQISIFNVELF